MIIPLLSVMAAYRIFVCALFLTHGVMWTGYVFYSPSTYLPAPQTTHTQINDMLPQHS